MTEPTIHSAAERVLDQAIEFTFPASDPIAVENAFLSARRRDRKRAAANSRRPYPPHEAKARVVLKRTEEFK